MSPREKRKMDHLNESAVKFAERLKRLGGTCRASKAADILGVKRQTINNRLKAKIAGSAGWGRANSRHSSLMETLWLMVWKKFYCCWEILAQSLKPRS